jgi:hypothetical protein
MRPLTDDEQAMLAEYNVLPYDCTPRPSPPVVLGILVTVLVLASVGAAQIIAGLL